MIFTSVFLLKKSIKNNESYVENNKNMVKIMVRIKKVLLQQCKSLETFLLSGFQFFCQQKLGHIKSYRQSQKLVTFFHKFKDSLYAAFNQMT